MQLLAICLIIAGVVVLALAVIRLKAATNLKRTSGEIIGLSARGGFLQPFKHASFRFTDTSGAVHEVWTPEGTGAGPGVGGPVGVAYDPAHPAQARVETPITRLALFMVGDALLIIGIVLLFVT